MSILNLVIALFLVLFYFLYFFSRNYFHNSSFHRRVLCHLMPYGELWQKVSSINSVFNWDLWMMLQNVSKICSCEYIPILLTVKQKICVMLDIVYLIRNLQWLLLSKVSAEFVVLRPNPYLLHRYFFIF